MTDTTIAPVGDGAPVAASVADTPASNEPLTLDEAFEQLQNERKKQPAERADAATADTKSADKADTAPADEQPSGEDEPEVAEQEGEDLPPIEPPRSWTKEAKEQWQSLPRNTQEYLAQREQERDREVRRSQNEAADQRKVIEAERIEAEKARKDYEAKLPAIMQALQDAQAGAFADIKTVEDSQRLASEDPFRYIQWQAHQDRLRAVNFEQEQSKQRQEHERVTNWNKFQSDEASKAAELHPELADPKRAEVLAKSAVELLVDKGFSEKELSAIATGKELSPYDHRMQSIIIDAIKYREAQKAKPVAVAKPIPPVQRPGVAPPRGAANAENLQALTQKLERSGSLDDAMALLTAKRKAS